MLPAIVALAGLALSAGSEIAAHKAQQKQFNANKQAAIKDFRLRVGDIEARRAEEGEASRLEVEQGRRTSLVEQGMLQLAMAENGVTGNTAQVAQDTLLSGFSEFRLTALANLALTDRALNRQIDASEADMQSRIASVQKPSTLATGLRLAGHAVNTAGSLSKMGAI